MRTGKLLTLGGVALCLAAVAGAVSYVRSIDFDRYRPALVEELSVATGRDVAIEGRMRLSLLPWPRFVLRDVAIANAPWGTRDALARIDRVEAELMLLPLLRGERRYRRIRLVNADLWLETDTVGKVNWVLAGGPVAAGGRGGAPGLLLGSLNPGRVEFDGGRITYHDGKTGDITVVSVRDASVEGDGVSKPLALAFAGRWDAIPVSLRGAIGPFNAIASDRGNASAVGLRLEFGSAAVRVDGTIGDPNTGPGVTMRVSAQAPEPDRLARRFGIALFLSETASLDAEVRYRNARLDVANARLAVGKTSASGTLSADLSKPRAVFSGDMRLTNADLYDLLPAGGKSAVMAGQLGPLEALIATGLLRMADGSMALRSDAMRIGGLTLRDVDARINVTDGGLFADPVRARSAGGVLEGSVHLDTGSAPPRLSVSVRAPTFTAGPLLQRLGTIKAFGGVASLAVNLSTVIGTPDVMLAGLEGEALLAMGEGRVTLEPYETPYAGNQPGPAGLVGILAAAGRQDVSIECVAGRLAVTRGIARSEGFVLLSEDARVKGDIRLDLTAGTLALHFIPEARNGPLLVDRPVSVTGSISAPMLTVETSSRAGAAVGEKAFLPLRRFFAGLAGRSEANACLRALPPPPARRPPPGAPIAHRPNSAVPEAVAPAAPRDPVPFGGVQAE